MPLKPGHTSREKFESLFPLPKPQHLSSFLNCSFLFFNAFQVYHQILRLFEVVPVPSKQVMTNQETNYYVYTNLALEKTE